MIENPHYLLNLLIDHVCADHLLSGDLDRLCEIDHLVPRNARFPGGRLWRVMIVPLDAVEILYEGSICVFPSNRFSSWSKSRENLENLEHTRASEMRDDQALLRFTRYFSPSDEGIDIEETCKTLNDIVVEGLGNALFDDGLVNFNAKKYPVWQKYIAGEQEVVFRDQGPDFEIMPHEVEKILFPDHHVSEIDSTVLKSGSAIPDYKSPEP